MAKERKLCKQCGTYPSTSKGKGKYHTRCWSCLHKPYRKFKKDLCECCGFKPTHPVQLDVDHIDGDHKNNDPDNLQTLCANCHRLKTYLNREHG